MGCNLVITAKGDTRAYFADDAFYCEPDSVSSIRDAVARAYVAPNSGELRRRIVKEFNWRVAAEKTLEGYERALAIREKILGIDHAETASSLNNLADVYRHLLAENQLSGNEVTERFYEIGSPEGLAELDAFLRQQPAVVG
jgi:hypothetical protein